MNSQNHIVSGIYASRAEAERVRSQLLERGLPRQQVKVVERARADDSNARLADDDEVLKEVLVDGTIGTLVGTGLGGLVGAAAGANQGATKHDGKFADLVHHAIRSGHVTLIAETLTAEERKLASEVIGDSLAAVDDHRVA